MLGPEKITEWYKKLGVERGFDLGLGGFSVTGQIADKLGTSDAIMMGMGAGWSHGRCSTPPTRIARPRRRARD
ncbi:MAG: hypothetical protein R3B46_12550 [Phycisphaerales bacterium]